MVIIVGSGAGGAILAMELAKSNVPVTIIEKGKYIDSKDAFNYYDKYNDSVNIIRDYKPVKKDKIILPDTVTGIIKCTNSKCITNYANEPITPKFNVINNHPPVVRCHYCEKLIKTEDIEKQFE